MRFALAAALACAVANCGGGNSCPVPTGTEFALMRTAVTVGSDDCPADVTTALEDLPQTLQTAQDYACGSNLLSFVTDFALTSGTDCTAEELVEVVDLEPSGGSGSDSAMITCNDGTQCNQSYDVVLSPP